MSKAITLEQLKTIISAIMAKMSKEEKSIGYPKVGEVMFYNKTTKGMEFKEVNESFTKDDNLTPIGIVVIPASHDVYGTGEFSVMSLMNMNADTPDEGGTANKLLYGGSLANIPNLTNYTEILGTHNDTEFTDTSTLGTWYNIAGSSLENTINLPYYDYNHEESNTVDGYVATYCSAVSPYKGDPSLEERNPKYSIASPTSLSVLTDFSGKENTAAILVSLGDESWKTEESLSNTTGSFAAYKACWRYKTEGTNSGDWYCPAFGELGYEFVNKKLLENIINILKAAYGDLYINNFGNSTYISSTSSGELPLMHTEIHGVRAEEEYNSKGVVRAFMRVSLVSSDPIKKELELLEEKINDLHGIIKPMLPLSPKLYDVVLSDGNSFVISEASNLSQYSPTEYTPIGIVTDISTKDYFTVAALTDLSYTFAGKSKPTKYMDYLSGVSVDTLTALSNNTDKDGSINTALLYSYLNTTQGENYKTSESIENTTNSLSLLKVLYKYKTPGTNSGDWFIPSVEQLYQLFIPEPTTSENYEYDTGYSIITNIIEKVNSWYGSEIMQGVTLNSSNYNYASVSVSSLTSTDYTLNTIYGDSSLGGPIESNVILPIVNTASGDTKNVCRPFCKIPYNTNNDIKNNYVTKEEIVQLIQEALANK